VAHYRTLLLNTVHRIYAHGSFPIIVGGSGFYLRSIFFPPLAPKNQLEDGVPCGGTWEQLYAIDPDRALAIDKADTYRINRALAIWYATGNKPSGLIPQYNPPMPSILIFATRPRCELYERINDRVKQMLRQGWLDEVASLRGTAWEHFLREKKLIGYNELLDFVPDAQSPDSYTAVAEAIARRTRQYAKRQYTFWNKLQRELLYARHRACQGTPYVQIESVDLTSLDLDLYINQLLKSEE
jgi:tRNA dimethylallyltransferase